MFCAEFTAEINRLSGAKTRGRRPAASAELAQVATEIDRLIQAIMRRHVRPEHEGEDDGARGAQGRARGALRDAGTRRRPAAPGAERPLPREGDGPDRALNDRRAAQPRQPGCCAGLIGEIRLVPDDGQASRSSWSGELAAILALGDKKTPRKGSAAGSVTLVAGVGFEPTTFRL